MKVVWMQYVSKKVAVPSKFNAVAALSCFTKNTPATV